MCMWVYGQLLELMMNTAQLEFRVKQVVKDILDTKQVCLCAGVCAWDVHVCVYV